MKNFRLVNVAVLCMALFSLFSSGCNKDKSPTKPEIEEPWTTFDVVYTPENYEDGPLTATIYQPSISNGVGIVLAHGMTANRLAVRYWADAFAAHGYVSMAIDYMDMSDAEGAVYPEPVRTFKIAVEFLRRNSDKYGITTGKIVGFGQSEGAMHWGQSIIWDNDDNFFQTDPTISDRLDAGILLYGIYDNNNFIFNVNVNDLVSSFFSPNPDFRSTKGNCIVNVSNIDTPVLLIHGTADGVVNSPQSVQLHDSLVANDKASNLILFPGEPHVFDDSFSSTASHSFSAAGLVAKDSVLAFLERTLDF